MALWHAVLGGGLRGNRGRTLLSILGIAFGVALGVAVTLINDTAVREFGQALRGLSGQADLVLRGPRAGFPETLYPALAQDPDVAFASPAIELDVSLPGRRETLKVLGVDPFQAARMRSSARLGGQTDVMAMLDPNHVYLSAEAARWLAAKAGDPLALQVGQAISRLRVQGILPQDASRQRLAVMDIAGAQWHFHLLGRLNRLDLRLKPGADPRAFQTRWQTRLPAGLTLAPPSASETRAADLSRAYRVNLTVLSLIALFTGAFLVFATLSMAVLRRRAQLALLRVLGLSRRGVVLLLLSEGLVIGILGAGLGLLLGWGLADLGLRVLGGDLGGGYFEGLRPTLHPQPLTLLTYFLLGTGVALLGAWAPAQESARSAPALALKSGDLERTLGRLDTLWPGLFLLGSGVVLSGLPAVAGLPIFAYIAIACLLVGTVLLLPRLLVLLTRVLPLPAQAPGQIAVAQLRGAPGQAAAAVAAIVVSFSLMVSMAIMVGSFRQSVADWLEQILPADLYLRATENPGTAYFDPSAQRRIATAPDVAHAEFLHLQELMLAPDKPAVALIARDFPATGLQSRVPLLARARIPPGAPPPVYISEAMQDLYGYRPGQRILLPLAGGRLAFTVAGVWRDYARQGGALIMDRALYVRLTGDTRASDAALWLRPGTAPGAVARALRTRLPQDGNMVIRTPAEIRRVSLAVFDRSFVVTYLLEGVAVLIGLFGISNSFSAQILSRRAEFGMLRHLGMDRAQIGRMLAIEAALLTGLGVLLGLALGAGISLILILVVNRQSFHWSMDLHWPLGLLGAISLLLIAAATLTALGSARRAMGDDILRAVREE